MLNAATHWPTVENFPEAGMVMAARILLSVLAVVALRKPAAVDGATLLSAPALLLISEAHKLAYGALLRP